MAEKERQNSSGKAGWSIEETELLFRKIDEAASKNQPIKRAFEAVAERTGRRPNSIETITM